MAYDDVPIDFAQMHPGSPLPARDMHMYLAPGGRFLVTIGPLDGQCWLNLWDLKTKSLRLEHSIVASNDRLPSSVYMEMVDSDKIQLIYEAHVDVDPMWVLFVRVLLKRWRTVTQTNLTHIIS